MNSECQTQCLLGQHIATTPFLGELSLIPYEASRPPTLPAQRTLEGHRREAQRDLTRLARYLREE